MEPVVDGNDSENDFDSHPVDYDSDYFVDVTRQVENLKGPVRLEVTHQTVPNFKAGYVNCTPSQILDAHTAELLRLRPRTMAQELSVMLDADYYSACLKTFGRKNRVYSTVLQYAIPQEGFDARVCLLVDHGFIYRLRCHLEECPDRDPLYLKFPVIICPGPNFHISDECVQSDVTVQVLAFWPRNITADIKLLGREAWRMSIDTMRVRIVCAPWLFWSNAGPSVQDWDVAWMKRTKYAYSNAVAAKISEIWPNIEAVWLVAVDYEASRTEWRPRYTQTQFKAAGNLTPVTFKDVRSLHIHRSLHSCLFRIPHSSYDFVYEWCFIASMLLKKGLSSPIGLDIMLTVGFDNALRWKSDRNAFPYKTITLHAMIVVLVSKGFGPWDVWQQMQALPYSYCEQTYMKYLTK